LATFNAADCRKLLNAIIQPASGPNKNPAMPDTHALHGALAFCSAGKGAEAGCIGIEDMIEGFSSGGRRARASYSTHLLSQ
jgi:hypothetical protein